MVFLTESRTYGETGHYKLQTGNQELGPGNQNSECHVTERGRPDTSAEPTRDSGAAGNKKQEWNCSKRKSGNLQKTL